MPRLELAWLLRHPHTPNTRNHSLLWCTVPQTMTSLPVLFRGCREESHPSSSVYEAPVKTRFFKQTPFHSYTVKIPIHCAHITKWLALGLKGKHYSPKTRMSRMVNAQPILGNWLPSHLWPYHGQNDPTQPTTTQIMGERQPLILRLCRGEPRPNQEGM